MTLISLAIVAMVCSIVTVVCLIFVFVETAWFLAAVLPLAFWSVVMWKLLLDRMDEEDISFGWYEYEEIWMNGYEEGYQQGYSAAEKTLYQEAPAQPEEETDPSRKYLKDILDWLKEIGDKQPLDITIIADGLTHDFQHIEDISKVEPEFLTRVVSDHWMCLGPDGHTQWVQIILEKK